MSRKIIYLISFRDYDYDGRLRALVDVFSQMGTLCLLSGGKRKLNKNHHLYNGSYFGFIIKAIKIAVLLKKIDYFVMDNRKATIPGVFIMKLLKPNISVLDCRELYIISEKKKIISKIGCLFEKYTAKRTNINISANEKRAKIMKKIYKLSHMPLVYENLRSLQYTSEIERQKAADKIGKFIHEDEYRIISSSGCLLDRTNDILVKNLRNVNSKIRLYLVGDSPKKDEHVIKNIISKMNLKNVEIMGRLNQNELKYLIEKSHIGIVNYNQNDTNNKYCASGKIYEFIYEGIPVVCTTNPPLKDLCETYDIGIADDEYYNGINKILQDYAYYISNVRRFSEKHTIKDNDISIVKQLMYRIENDQ